VDFLEQISLRAGEGDIGTVATGETFQVPFDAFVIFSTNIDTSKVFDLAMRRRIHYKIHFSTPPREEFEQISLRVFRECTREDVAKIVDYVYAQYYNPKKLEPARFHPKWLHDHVLNYCRYESKEFEVSRKLIDLALENL